MRKLTSTNLANEKDTKLECPMFYTLSLIKGRWKPLILYRLRNESLRYSDLRKSVEKASERLYLSHLRQLESDDLVTKLKPLPGSRTSMYTLTPRGQTLMKELQGLCDWGLKNS